MKLPSLKERLEAKKLVDASSISRQENQEPAQSTQNALNSQGNTNISILAKNAPDTQGVNPSPIVGSKKSLLQILAEQKAKNPISTKPLSLREQLEKKKLEADMRKLESSSISSTIESSGTVVQDFPDSKLQESLKEKTTSSILERMKARVSVLSSNDKEKVAEALKILEESQEEKEETYTNTHTFSLDIVLNENQQSAVDLAKLNKSFVLLGAAGTGKTTSERGIAHAILNSPTISRTKFKVSGITRIEAPSVAFCAYTRRATANSAKAILKDPELKERLPHNIMTVHALLEYAPVTYFDDVLQKEVFRFEPMRHRNNPLTITHLVLEEATLIGLDLWEKLYDALPEDVTIIYVGDVNQLPPVFGPSILNYALTQLPVIELTQVYRQAEGSPIIDNAHRILRGNSLKEGVNDFGKFTIIRGKNPTQVGQNKTALAIAKMFEQYYDMGIYNPDTDMILAPYNKQALGTVALNTMIAEFLSIKNNVVVHEVIAGFNKLYLAEGDKVIYNKQDATIISIEGNPAYIGRYPKDCSQNLSRWGHYRLGGTETMDWDEDDISSDYTAFDVDALAEEGERKMQSSHRVKIVLDDGNTVTLEAAGDLNPQIFYLGYSMTTHKAQGSEWRRVFIVLHKDQQRNLSREWLYTAITRAREEVYLIAKDDVLDKTIATQRMKGDTLADKIAFFNSGVEMRDPNIKAHKGI